jgi:hypothetical protein
MSKRPREEEELILEEEEAPQAKRSRILQQEILPPQASALSIAPTYLSLPPEIRRQILSNLSATQYYATPGSRPVFTQEKQYMTTTRPLEAFDFAIFDNPKTSNAEILRTLLQTDLDVLVRLPEKETLLESLLDYYAKCTSQEQTTRFMQVLCNPIRQRRFEFYVSVPLPYKSILVEMQVTEPLPETFVGQTYMGKQRVPITLAPIPLFHEWTFYLTDTFVNRLGIFNISNVISFLQSNPTFNQANVNLVIDRITNTRMSELQALTNQNKSVHVKELLYVEQGFTTGFIVNAIGIPENMSIGKLIFRFSKATSQVYTALIQAHVPFIEEIVFVDGTANITSVPPQVICATAIALLEKNPDIVLTFNISDLLEFLDVMETCAGVTLNPKNLQVIEEVFRESFIRRETPIVMGSINETLALAQTRLVGTIVFYIRRVFRESVLDTREEEALMNNLVVPALEAAGYLVQETREGNEEIQYTAVLPAQ